MTNRALMCVGELAKTPYYFDKAYVNIYSIEELCYVLYENAFMIDRDILDRKLVDWIDKELNLPDLARDLYPLINQNALPESFVGTILQYAGYYSKDEIDKAESVLRMNVSMSVFEKWKAKADFLFENRHYLLAIKEYEHVLSVIDEDETDLKSRIYNNMGVTYMALYYFDSAIECFKNAYEINNDPTAYRHLLTANRLKMSEEEYIRLIAEEEDAYRLSIPIEGALKQAKEEFDETEEARNMKEMFLLKDNNETAKYYEQITAMTEQIKNDYREIAFETGEL